MFLAAEYSAEITQTIISWRLVAVVLFPLLAALITALLGRNNGFIAAIFAICACALNFIGVLSLFPMLQQGVLEYPFAELMSVGLLFRADYLSFIFATLISLAWLTVMLFAQAAVDDEEQRKLYFPFSLITLGSCLGVVLTGDLITLFLFFELMTFSSFVLVILRRNREALIAGTFTLYMGLAGGLVMLLGIFSLYNATGTVELIPMMEKLAASEANLPLIITCLFIGFGIKAVVIPFHLWIPRAYSAAPAAVNALSSGAMIKVGVYGLIRVFFVILTPTSLEMGELFNFVRAAGYPVMWLGLLTMVVGAVMALQQDNIMKLLAYSSVSQMGYIITGIGAGAYLFGLEEAMGYSGAVLHAFNHTLFKVAFILIAGIVYYCCGELDMQKIEGLWKKIPAAGVLFVISALAITGIPGFNGYISKTLIHDALLEAYYAYGGLHIYIAEKVFMVGSALTLCYYLKFFQGVFGGKIPFPVLKRRPPFLLYIPFFFLIPLMLAVGLFPNYFVEGFVLASVADFTFEPYSINHIIGFQFFGAHPLEAALMVLLIGLLLYLPLVRMGFLTRPLPRWLSIEYLVLAPLVSLSLNILLRSGGGLDRGVNRFYHGLAAKFLSLTNYFSAFDQRVDLFYSNSGDKVRNLVESFRTVDDKLNQVYDRTGKEARDLAGKTRKWDGALDKGYEKAGEYARNLTKRTSEMDEALDHGYEKAGEYARNLTKRTSELDEALDHGYEKAGSTARRLVDRTKENDEWLNDGKDTTDEKAEADEKHKQPAGLNPLEWNIRNLNFDSLLLAVMLGLVIFVLLFFARGLVNL